MVGLGGCAAVEIPALSSDVPTNWRQPLKTSPGAIEPDLRNWWAALGDPQLNALVDRAMAQNLTLAQARSRLRQVRFLARRDDAKYRPMFSASFRPLQDVSATDSYFQSSLDAVWELGLFGGREAAERGTRGRVAAAVATTQAARVSTVAEVVRTYADLRAAQIQKVHLQRLVDLNARTLQLLEIRRGQGLSSADDEFRVEMRLAQVRSQLSQSSQVVEQSASGLALLLGQATPDDEWTQAIDWPPQSQLGARNFALQQVPTDLLRYRPEIRNAEADVLKAAAELGSAKAELYPRVMIGSSWLYSHNLTQHSRRTSDSTPTIGPFIDIPLFDWGRRRAAVSAQKEALDASVLAYRQAVIEGVAEAESALNRLQRALERCQNMQAVLDATQRRTKVMVTLKRLDLASELDRLEAERAATQASMELAAARVDHTLAFVALYKSLGGAPWPAEEALEPLSSSAPSKGGAR
ncbi:Toluene efflux pump outer membrane protein TtgF precursor [compost metagenome]